MQTNQKKIITTSQVLVIALNRWSNNLQKLQDTVRYPNVLNVENEQQKMKYTLKGILCHQGYSLYSGHYHAFVKNNHSWYHMNDENVDFNDLVRLYILNRKHQVEVVSTSCAFQQQAFILFYELGSESEVTEPVVDQTSAKKKKSLTLKHTRLSHARKKEEVLFCCVAEHNYVKAHAVAEDLKQLLISGQCEGNKPTILYCEYPHQYNKFDCGVFAIKAAQSI